ncbi:MAG: multidrug ABC transporter ATPase/permease [Bacteroidetes bacterium]|nr:MAG: multidrug ABC transporter ATPase/permease [Bacteroidota bacterium]
MSSGVSGKAFDFSLLKRVFRYVKPYRGLFTAAVVLTIVLSAMSIVRPLIIRYVVDHYIRTPADAAEKSQLISDITFYSAILIGLLIAEAFMQFFNAYVTSLIGQSIVKDLRKQVHKKVLSFRSKYFDNTPIGTLVTRVISDLEAISDVFSQGFIVIAGDLLTIIVFLVAMLTVNWKLTLIVLTTIPVMFIATWIFKNAIKSAFTDVRNQVAKLNAFVQEHITGMKIVQVFSREKVEMERFQDINKKHRDANIRSVWHYSVFFPVVEILSSVSLGLLIWFGGRQVYQFDVKAGDLVFFILLISMFFRPIRMLADRINTLQMGMVASERVFKVLDTVEIIDDKGTLDATQINGSIEFRDVHFAYNNEDWVLRGISMQVKPGETIALVGATGSGKTSVINLINRNYEYNTGEILIDGHNVREYGVASLRSSIGVVLQDVFLFSGSILDNITLMNPEISKENVVAAAKAVGAHDFIMALPGGYDYNVMERGSMLSVGQRQLIAFIRAYVYNPRVLVLDEATSSIDTESEILIQRATETLTKGRTSIVIAHRLATIQKADRILVMDHGQIIESGSHQELLQQNGQYRKLYELQFKQEEVA